MDAMYRLLALAKYDERYVIPTQASAQAAQLEEMACAVDSTPTEQAPRHGPFGEASGLPQPASVEKLPRPQAAADQRRAGGPGRQEGPRQPAQLGRPRMSGRPVPAQTRRPADHPVPAESAAGCVFAAGYPALELADPTVRT